MTSTLTRSANVAFWVFTLAALGFALNLGFGFQGQAATDTSDADTVQAPVKAAPQAAFQPLSKYLHLAQSPVFEAQGQAPPPAPVVELNLPRMKGHRLIGLMAGSRDHALAVVEETKTGQQKIAGIGERLGPGVLVAVFLDRVVVEIDGQRQQLVMADRTAEEMAEVITLRDQDRTATKDPAEPEKAKTAALERPKARVAAPLGAGMKMKYRTGK